MDGSVTITAGRDPRPPVLFMRAVFMRALFAWPCVPCAPWYIKRLFESCAW